MYEYPSIFTCFSDFLDEIGFREWFNCPITTLRLKILNFLHSFVSTKIRIFILSMTTDKTVRIRHLRRLQVLPIRLNLDFLNDSLLLLLLLVGGLLQIDHLDLEVLEGGFLVF